MNTGLSLKASVQDVSRTVAQIAQTLDDKVSFEDCQTLLKDYVIKADFQYLMSSKVEIDEMKKYMETKLEMTDFKRENIRF